MPVLLTAFQEWTFSRRLLIFHYQTVSWCCEEFSQQENGSNQSWGSLQISTQKTSIWKSWPDLSSYGTVVQQYNTLTFGRQEDILNAFAAFITVYGRTMRGDMLFGVPELFFPGMLLFTCHPWSPTI